MQYAKTPYRCHTPDFWTTAVVQKCYDMLCLYNIKEFIIAIHFTGMIIT